MEGLSFKKLSLLSPLSDLLRFHKNKSFGCGVHSPSTLFFILLQLNHEQVSTYVHLTPVQAHCAAVKSKKRVTRETLNLSMIVVAMN